MTKLKAVTEKSAKKKPGGIRGTPLLRLAPPPVRGKRIPRPSLEERHSRLKDYSLTLLVAPQGYGKTHLLVRWYSALLESGSKPIWISLDHNCNNIAKLTDTLLDACAPLLNPQRVEALHECEESAEQTIYKLCNLLHDSDPDLLFVIDQYERLSEPGARKLLTEFLFHLPPDNHKVLASTSTPSWMTPKLQLEDNVQILGKQELAFSVPELEEFLRLEGQTPLTEEEVLSLMDVTGGWPAALKLVSLAFNKAKTPREHANILHGEFPLLFEYLDRNIISELPPALQAFLSKTAHLQRLRVDLCNHVCDFDDAGDCVETLLGLGLLEGNSYADNWFSYPPLLRNFLNRQLLKEGRGKLMERHCRASDWYIKFGLPDTSLYHALQAEDYGRAVAIYATNARDLVVAGGAALIEQFIRSLPPETMEEHPYILWPYVWMLIISQRFLEAKKYLPELQNKLALGIEDKSSVPLTPAPEDLEAIEYRIKQALDSEWAEPALWLKLKRKRGSKEDFLQEQIELSLGSAYFRRNKFSDAFVAFNEAKRLAELNHTPITSVSATTRMAEIRYMQGQLSEAMYLCNDAIDLAASVPGQFSPLAGIPLLLNSRILFDQNRIAESGQNFYEARDMFRQYRATHYLTDSAIHRARLANISSGWQGALHILEEAIGHLPENIYRSNVNQLRAEQVKYEILGGQLEQAGVILERLGAPLSSRGPDPTFHCKRSEECIYLSYCRYLIQTGNSSTASAWLTKLFNQARSTEKLSLAVEISVLLVLAHDGGDNERRTLRSVREMLLLADQTGVIRPLIEGGDTILRLVREFHKSQGQKITESEHGPSACLINLLLDPEQGNTQQFISDGNNAAPSAQASNANASTDTLTPRELELLTLISEGLSNKMMASELIIGEGTVKWHLKNIFLKLGVSSRTQAASKARSMGLLV